MSNVSDCIHHVFTRIGKGPGEAPKPKCVCLSVMAECDFSQNQGRERMEAAEWVNPMACAPDRQARVCEKHSQNGFSTPGRARLYGVERKNISIYSNSFNWQGNPVL